MFGSPGVDHRSVERGLVRRAHGKLVHIELAQHHGAVPPEVGRDGRLVLGLEAVEDVARRLGVDALGREQILDAERNALERALLSQGAALVAGIGHLARLVGRHRHVGVELGVCLLDGAQIGLGQLDRGKVLLSQPIAGRGQGQVGKVGQRKVLQHRLRSARFIEPRADRRKGNRQGSLGGARGNRRRIALAGGLDNPRAALIDRGVLSRSMERR
jgi:hypothetical protein